jgi:hypothetical protein
MKLLEAAASNTITLKINRDAEVTFDRTRFNNAYRTIVKLFSNPKIRKYEHDGTTHVDEFDSIAVGNEFGIVATNQPDILLYRYFKKYPNENIAYVLDEISKIHQENWQGGRITYDGADGYELLLHMFHHSGIRYPDSVAAEHINKLAHNHPEMKAAKIEGSLKSIRKKMKDTRKIIDRETKRMEELEQAEKDILDL